MSHDADQHKREYKELPAKELWAEPAYQRAIIPGHVEKLKRNMDLDAIGSLLISRRKVQGKWRYVVIDGGHRHRALLELGLGDWPVSCLVYRDLSEEEEAGLFRKYNDAKRPTAFDDYNAGLVEGDEECHALKDITESTGLEIRNSTGDGVVTCVATLRRVYRRAGAEGLTNSLQVATAAWGRTAPAVEGKIIDGLGRVFAEYNGAVDEDVLSTKLAKQSSPAALIGMAKSRSRVLPGSIGKHMADIIVETYNVGRRSGKL